MASKTVLHVAPASTTATFNPYLPADRIKGDNVGRDVGLENGLRAPVNDAAAIVGRGLQNAHRGATPGWTGRLAGLGHCRREALA